MQLYEPVPCLQTNAGQVCMALRASSLHAGKFQEAAHAAAAQAREVTDRSARGDHILWLHPGRPPATSNSQLMSLLHALQVRKLA